MSAIREPFFNFFDVQNETSRKCKRRELFRRLRFRLVAFDFVEVYGSISMAIRIFLGCGLPCQFQT